MMNKYAKSETTQTCRSSLIYASGRFSSKDPTKPKLERATVALIPNDRSERSSFSLGSMNKSETGDFEPRTIDNQQERLKL
ncbi:hypothetical protein HanIR_Chr13g0623011 [Helianthus annuus]|nr:hypothetical protein HanIR_Chr13g0623011 [Helianthus annuus]